MSVIWGVNLMLIALFFDESDKAIVIVGFKIASFTYGGLLLLFLFLKTELVKNTNSILIGFIIAIASVFLLNHFGI